MATKIKNELKEEYQGIKYILTSTMRTKLLLSIYNESKNLDDLRIELEKPSATILHGLNELENLNFVKKVQKYYQLTSNGYLLTTNMIKLIDNPDEFDTFNKDDIFFIRIMSLLKAYSTEYNFALFYKQIDENENITAIISRLDNDYTVCHYDNFNQKELDDFFKTLGFNSILCDEDLKLSFSYDYGITMATNKKIEKTINYAEIDEYPKLMDLFNLEDYSSADFESWYVDVSHRIRHGAAKAVTLNINGEIISSGIFSSIYNNDAILTAVSTQSEFRRMGYASALVSAMVCDIKGKVYLMRDKNKNEEFYKKLGFENIGYWRMYK